MQITRDTITLHGREGLALELFFVDDAGAPVPVTGRSYFFEVEGVFRAPMIAGSLASSIKLEENRVACEAIGPAATDFALIDETDPVQSVIWAGSIRRSGFTQEPPPI